MIVGLLVICLTKSSVVLWLLPYNYLWLIQLVKSNKEKTTWQGYSMQTTYDSGQTTFDSGKDQVAVQEQLLNQGGTEAVTARTRQQKSKLYWTAVGIAVLTSLH